MNNYRNAIGRKIKHFRKQLGLTLEDLSDRTDLSVSFIGEIERGKKDCSIKTLSKIVDKLNISLSTLFDFAKDKPIENNAYVKEIRQLLKPLNKSNKEFILSFLRTLTKRIKN